MRLIDSWTFDLREFDDDAIPDYAILSHTWAEGEASFTDMKDLDCARRKLGFTKIARAAELAVEESLRWLWVDTCCIDKTSSAELQEAINSSMSKVWRWYRDAAVCYVFFTDLPRKMPYLTDEGVYRHANSKRMLSISDTEHTAIRNQFTSARWFSRGWCLQELIAPSKLRFYTLRPNGGKCRLIGDRGHLVQTISKATNIASSILDKTADLKSMSVAQRMSWAANRQTRRIEDRAYSLLGIFDVSMPMLYGEGRRAFIRLQEEIIRGYSDQSILAWGRDGSASDGSLLAASPSDFVDASSIVQWGHAEPFEMTNRGLRISLSILSKEIARQKESLAILNCRYVDADDYAIALRLSDGILTSGVRHVLVRSVPLHTTHTSEPRASRLAMVHSREAKLLKTPSIIIARNFEPASDNVRFKLHFDTSRADRSHHYLEDIHAEHKIDTPGVHTFLTMRTPAARVGVMLKFPSGRRVSLVFGFDAYPNDSLLLPGIWAKFHRGPQELKDIIRSEPVHQHGRAEICKYPYMTGCPYMPDTAHVHLWPEGDVLDACIEHARVLEENVFTVRAVIKQVYELEAISPMESMRSRLGHHSRRRYEYPESTAVPGRTDRISGAESIVGLTASAETTIPDTFVAKVQCSSYSDPPPMVHDAFVPETQRDIYSDPPPTNLDAFPTTAVLTRPYEQPDRSLLQNGMLSKDSTFMMFQALPFRFESLEEDMAAPKSTARDEAQPSPAGPTAFALDIDRGAIGLDDMPADVIRRRRRTAMIQ